MINLSDKIENNVELNTKETLDNMCNNQENTSLDNTETANKESFSNNDSVNENSVDSSVEDNANIYDESSEVTNCLALTIKKDYNLSIVKNVVSTTLRSMWKVIASFFALNFFKFFL